ncbi:MAG TPA: hypothetical protein DD706_21500 [Nitrospiraceae bacterium]|nr:hypothetical protein [Nitrospiraceae bacterium]
MVFTHTLFQLEWLSDGIIAKKRDAHVVEKTRRSYKLFPMKSIQISQMAQRDHPLPKVRPAVWAKRSTGFEEKPAGIF